MTLYLGTRNHLHGIACKPTRFAVMQWFVKINVQYAKSLDTPKPIKLTGIKPQLKLRKNYVFVFCMYVYFFLQTMIQKTMELNGKFCNITCTVSALRTCSITYSDEMPIPLRLILILWNVHILQRIAKKIVNPHEEAERQFQNN